MRLTHSLSLGLAAIVVVPAFLFSQGPGGMGGGFGGSPPSPDRIWSFIDKTGKGYIDRNEIADPIQKMMFDRFTSQMGITGDRVTKDDFAKGYEKMNAMRMNGGGRGGSGGMGSGLGGPGGTSGSRSGFDMDKFAEEKFKEYDRDSDGKLSFEELPESMKLIRDQYDTDRDGFIDIAEYKLYIKARFPTPGVDSGGPGMGAGTIGGSTIVEEDKRPTVFRVGKLPKELPAWFGTLDTDLDGQVGLYEWRKGKGSIDEFMEMDLDGDGLLTAEEVLKFNKLASAKAAKNDSSGNSRTASVASGSGFGGSSGGRSSGDSGGRGSGGSGSGRGQPTAPPTAPTTTDANNTDRKDNRPNGRPTRKN